MATSLEELEDRLAHLRTELRHAVRAGEHHDAGRLRGALRAAEQAWEEQLAAEETAAPAPVTPRPAPVLPVREQVHKALTVLGAPASPKLIATAYEALFSRPLDAARTASLRRDEQRSYLAGHGARPYYVCAALGDGDFRAARGLLALSTWPLERRILTPSSTRLNFLTHAIGLAEHLRHLQRLQQPQHHQQQDRAGAGPNGVRWLLRRFALAIPNTLAGTQTLDTDRLLGAARTERDALQSADTLRREDAVGQARHQLDPVQQLFGSTGAKPVAP